MNESPDTSGNSGNRQTGSFNLMHRYAGKEKAGVRAEVEAQKNPTQPPTQPPTQRRDQPRELPQKHSADMNRQTPQNQTPPNQINRNLAPSKVTPALTAGAQSTAHPDVNKNSSNLYRHSDLPQEMTPGKRKPTREAAVLIPLLKQNDEWHVLFIRRSENQDDRHSGQVAFPGGATEENDASLIDTALRETREEIGIQQDDIKVISTLKPYHTISYFRVTPVVGLLSWPCTMKLQNSEVARAFTIPLEWLQNENNFELRERKTTTSDIDAPERRYPIVYFKEYDGEILWGATARMTLNFLKAVKDHDLLLPG